MKGTEFNNAIKAIEAKGYKVYGYDNYEMGKLNEKHPYVYEILNEDYSTVYGYGCCGEEAVIYFAQVILGAEIESENDEQAEEIARLEKIIKKAEQQNELPTKAEKAAKLKAYNNLHNEGGEGYVPWIVSREEYQAAREELKRLKEE